VPLTGAGRELRILESLGRGGEILVLQGHVASGKTTSLHEIAELAVAEGNMVLHAVAAWTEIEFQFGVIRQLLTGPHIPRNSADNIAILLDDGALSAALSEPDVRQPTAARIMEVLWSEFLALSVRRPLVLIVDDIHYADTSSKECILYFARRLKSAPILMVLAEDKRPWQTRPFLQAELLRLPNCRTVHLRPLSQQEVADLVSTHHEIRQSEQLAVAIHRAGGGNPLLTLALIDDYLDRPSKAGGEMVTGDAFDRAVQSCLSRCDPEARRLAQALAVLNAPVSVTMLGQMLGAPAASAAGTLPELAEMGLVSAGRFRHPATRMAVLSMLRPPDLAALHLRAADVLHQEHGAPRMVAEHLIAAGNDVDADWQPWASAVLLEAADGATAESDLAFATRCLWLGLRLCDKPGDRSAITSSLAAVRWLADPAATFRYLPELGREVRSGNLAGPVAARIVHHQMWAGMTHEALATLDEACRGQPDARLHSELLAARLWLSCLSPAFQIRIDSSSVTAPGHSTSPHLRAARLAHMVVADRTGDAAVAEQVPQVARMDDTALAMAGVAMAAAIASGESTTLALWSEAFLDSAQAQEAALRRFPTCRALLAGTRAAIHIRLGDIRAAEAQAREAMTHMSPPGWGILAGVPAVVLTLTAVAAGKLDDAAGYLGIPVPDAMFATVLGPVYLYARGRYHLAAGKYKFALQDFEMCGEVLVQWHADHPGFVPWRVGAAEACLGSGAIRDARDLLTEHLSLLGSRRGRAYGAWLRVRAAASPLSERPSLLREAVEILQECDDRLAAAQAFADLSQAHGALGERGEATRMRRRARHLARQCGADALGEAGRGTSEDRQAAPGDASGLSEAERRIAALAAHGYTNREIAGRLYVTVSTVEQHLTHAYRKLKVNRRTDLPSLPLTEPVGSTYNNERSRHP
jgi:DNA-binding CsgD family transcriptional regulator